MEPSTPLLVTPAQVAKLTDLSPRTVQQLITDGRLPSVRIGRARRIRFDELQRWIAAQGNDTTAERQHAA